MAKKKRPTKAEKKESRLARAKVWIKNYEGTKVVRAYRKKYDVSAVCAVREIQEIGYKLEPGYVDNLIKSVKGRCKSIKNKKKEKKVPEEFNTHQDDNFFFIAGYTSGGAPYGVTWQEMNLEPYEELV